MSVRYINWAFSQNLKSPMQKLVLVKIADNADDSGLAWPSVDTIAKFTCTNEKTVRRAIKELETKRLMTVKKMPASKNHKRNEYHLHIEVVLHYETVANESPDYESKKELSPDSVSIVTGLSVHCHRSESPDNHQLTVNESKVFKDYVQSDDYTSEEEQVNQEKQNETEQEVNPVNDQPKLLDINRLPTNQVKQSEVSTKTTSCSADENKDHFDKDAAFEVIWKEYPTRNGAKGSKANTKRLCEQIAKTRDEWVSLLKKVRQYKLWASHTGKEGTEHVMQTTTFFGKQKQGYLEDWAIVNRQNQLAITGGTVQTSSKSHNAMAGFASMTQPTEVKTIQDDFLTGEIVDV